MRRCDSSCTSGSSLSSSWHWNRDIWQWHTAKTLLTEIRHSEPGFSLAAHKPREPITYYTIAIPLRETHLLDFRFDFQEVIYSVVFAVWATNATPLVKCGFLEHCSFVLRKELHDVVREELIPRSCADICLKMRRARILIMLLCCSLVMNTHPLQGFAQGKYLRYEPLSSSQKETCIPALGALTGIPRSSLSVMWFWNKNKRKTNSNSIDSVYTNAGLCWCFLPSWLFPLWCYYCVLEPVCFYTYLQTLKATVTLGRILSTWPASCCCCCGVRVTGKWRFAAFHQQVSVYLLAIWKRSPPNSAEGSMRVWNKAQEQRFPLQNCSFHLRTERG